MEVGVAVLVGSVLGGWQVARLMDPGGFLYTTPWVTAHAILIGVLVGVLFVAGAARRRADRERQLVFEVHVQPLVVERDELVRQAADGFKMGAAFGRDVGYDEGHRDGRRGRLRTVRQAAG